MCASDRAALDEFQEKLRETLKTHSEEVEESIAARVRNNDFDLPMSPEFMAGLGLGATESLNMMIESFEVGFDWSPVVPPEMSSYIRYLAREEVPLEVVMRLCSLMGGVFVEVLLSKLGDAEAKIALHYMAAWGMGNLDRLLNAFAAEYTDELKRMNDSPTRELRGRVRRLLQGGTEDASALDYRIDAFHTGLIVMGKKGDLICRRLAEKVGCELLLVPDAQDSYWAWLGAQRPIEVSEIERSLPAGVRTLSIATGEPREGSHGWRLTHREAQSALPVARLDGPGLIRHSNVALLASALCDAAIGRSLMDRYLKPLDGRRDAADLRRTLRVYFELSCNAVSTASALEVNRHTVQRRLKRVEEAIGEPPSARQAEFGVALELEQLTDRTRAAFA